MRSTTASPLTFWAPEYVDSVYTSIDRGMCTLLTSMASEVPTTPKPTSYHHGDLRVAAIAVGLDLARRGGAGAVGLRETARETGVTPAALYRHFPDVEHLRAEVAAAARSELARHLERARTSVLDSGDRRRDDLTRLREVGRAYIDFALAEPHLFTTAFACPFATTTFSTSARSAATTDAPDAPAEPSAWDIVVACVDAAGASGGIDANRLADAPLVMWTAIHGAATVLVQGASPTPLDAGHLTAVTLNAAVRALG